ncbi:thioredoxin [Micractinium conductrix]|uniref:Thioredoxin n=1 Tax=Micractinium conductrix TaxID=554055 RepID=A0A2P6VKM5_9CHLO|nr:thioredoxin [Micractinium conductrix]|eukprot:PSC74643.1 thioredoxin [Micractinium conductrix]
MEARCVSHSLASCSGLARPVSVPQQRAVARAPRLALRVQAVSSISRHNAGASASSYTPLHAPEDLGSLVTSVHSPEEFKDALAAAGERMVVLMCKAVHCRPCKLFAKTYAAAAAQYSDAHFYEILGDESKATRAMMIENKVRVTPTFLIFRNGERVHSHGGVNETNLHRYITKFLQPSEAGYGSFVEPEGVAEEK